MSKVADKIAARAADGPARAGQRKRYWPRTPAEWADNRAKTQTIIRNALMRGSHSNAVTVMCPTCREWCDGIWEGAIDGSGRDACLPCVAKRHGMTVPAYLAALRSGAIK